MPHNQPIKTNVHLDEITTCLNTKNEPKKDTS